jgi:hypothetical protein
MAEISWKWMEMDSNGWKWPKNTVMAKTAKMAKIAKNGQKWPKTVKNSGPKTR